MKRLVLVFLLFVCSFEISIAQMQYKTGQLYISPVISLGLPAIINQNNYGFGEMAYDLKTGGQAGVLFGYDNYLKTSFRYGVLYSEIGQRYSDILLDIPHEKNITLEYIQVPVVYKYVFGNTKGFDFEKIYKYIFGGFQVGYLLSADIQWIRDGKEVDMYDFISYGPYKDVNKNLDEILEIGIPANKKKLYNPIDLAIVGGAGAQYFFARRFTVFGELVGNIGLMDINAPTWRFRNNKKAYNQSLNVFAGLRFGITYYP